MLTKIFLIKIEGRLQSILDQCSRDGAKAATEGLRRRAVAGYLIFETASLV